MEVGRELVESTEAVRVRLVDQIVRQHRVSVSVIGPGGVAVGGVIWWATRSTGAIVWAAAIVALHALVALAHRRLGTEGGHLAGLRTVSWANGALGVGVGALPWLAMPTTPEAQAIMGLFLAMMLLPNVIDSAAVAPVFWAFHGPAALIPALAFLRVGDSQSQQVAASIVVTAVVSAWFARTVRTVMEERAASQIANEALVAELTATNEQLAAQARRDPLTGLANRRGLDDALESALATAEQRAASPTDGPRAGVGTIAFDLDRFKAVNDSLGHEAGDELLVSVAQRLTAAAPADALVARIGGDEIVVLVPDVGGLDELEEQRRRLTATFDEPFSLRGNQRAIESSSGIAFRPNGSPMTARALLRAADMDLYESKRTRLHRAAARRIERGVRGASDTTRA